jgi:hypothetical protein
MDPHPNLSYGINYRTNTFTQCCGSGSGTGRIRNFWPDPDLIRNRNKGFEPDPATLHLPYRHKKLGQYDNSGLRVRITLMRIRPGFSLSCESGIGFKIMPSNEKKIYLFLQFDEQNTALSNPKRSSRPLANPLSLL